MKAAYLLGTNARYSGKVSRKRYRFSPWADVDEADWPAMEDRIVHHIGCCGKPSRVDRVFGTEEEVATGTVATYWR